MKRQVNGLLVATLITTGALAMGQTPVTFAQAAAAVKAQPATDYQNHQYKTAIDYVLNKNVMWKFADGTFKPEVQMTQGQLLTSLVTVMQLKEKTPVVDLPIGHWAKDAYEKANKVGILAGVTIDPNKPLTKEEASLIVNNAWKPYRGGIWPGNTNYQHLQSRSILPRVWGQTGESPFVRAEGALVLEFLHVEYNGIVSGGKIADQFHASLKVENGFLLGTVPTSKDHIIYGTILLADDSIVYLKPGTKIKVKANIKAMVFTVALPKKAGLVTSYSYTELPKLTRVNMLLK
ncbi:S-layer homology domain-containing protein [Brevibacillus reuszeri]|uniref:S-layer homology domain-containing protein n=1 Tax=Brevibacillus reuszeri TaxID=54915 RepID=UPI003D2226B0